MSDARKGEGESVGGTGRAFGDEGRGVDGNSLSPYKHTFPFFPRVE